MESSIFRFCAISLVATMLTGCATTFGRHHDEESVTFDSNVPGVEVICSGKRVETPGSIPLMQSKTHSCTAQKEGYEKKAFQIRSGTSWSGFGFSTALNTAAWGWWTLGIGTAIGWLVDWPSGSMRNLKEENLYLEMKPENSAGKADVSGFALKADKELINTPTTVVQGGKELKKI